MMAFSMVTTIEVGRVIHLCVLTVTYPVTTDDADSERDSVWESGIRPPMIAAAGLLRSVAVPYV